MVISIWLRLLCHLINFTVTSPWDSRLCGYWWILLSVWQEVVEHRVVEKSPDMLNFAPKINLFVLWQDFYVVQWRQADGVSCTLHELRLDWLQFSCVGHCVDFAFYKQMLFVGYVPVSVRAKCWLNESVHPNYQRLYTCLWHGGDQGPNIQKLCKINLQKCYEEIRRMKSLWKNVIFQKNLTKNAQKSYEKNVR